MPDARVESDGTLRFGLANEDPYFSVWGSVTLFPRLELSGRYVKIDGVSGFPDAPELGDYRDKALDAKLLLLKESTYLPALAIGSHDYVGTRLFASRYVALSKRAGPVDLTVGYGEDRIAGLFGGIRYLPGSVPGLGLVLEYDANDYTRDHAAALSGASDRAGGITYGVEYRYGWLGGQLSYQSGDLAANAYVSIPLMQREFIPKLEEPAPYSTVTERVSADEWRSDPRYVVGLGRALERQGFEEVKLRFSDEVLEAALTHGRVSLIGRAVGRAARTILLLGPRDMRAIRILYTENEQPLLVYDFLDLAVLDRYFDGQATRLQLDETVKITFASSEHAIQLRDVVAVTADGVDDAGVPPPTWNEGRYVEADRQDPYASGFDILPFNARVFFNDPGEPVRYDTFALLTYGRRVAPGTYLDGAVRATLVENVSEIRQPSTSLLPHVRSDIGDYRREGKRVRLNALLLNKYTLLAERWYGRLSGGYYEEMYAGVGGQVLFLPRTGDWAVDLAMDRLRQREPGASFGFRDYRVLTGILSAHYRLPRYGVTTTARVGRFLARDEGVRLEVKRRFQSGVEIGAWYTWTNERDITNPGTPEDPYRDKGLFFSVPLKSMLTRDTQETASMAIADYVRDVGQMVVSPGDLYRLVERPLDLGASDRDPLADFIK